MSTKDPLSSYCALRHRNRRVAKLCVSVGCNRCRGCYDTADDALGDGVIKYFECRDKESEEDLGDDVEHEGNQGELEGCEEGGLGELGHDADHRGQAERAGELVGFDFFGGKRANNPEDKGDEDNNRQPHINDRSFGREIDIHGGLAFEELEADPGIDDNVQHDVKTGFKNQIRVVRGHGVLPVRVVVWCAEVRIFLPAFPFCARTKIHMAGC